jgi:hypothetical protein
MAQRRDKDGKYWDTFRGKPVWGRVPAAAWETARIADVTTRAGQVWEFVDALRSVQNAEVIAFGQFLVEPRREFDWFVSPEVWSIVPPGRFASTFVKHAVVQARLEDLLADVDLDEMLHFDQVSPLAVEGALAAQLFEGGAYGNHNFSAIQARDLARGFCTSLFGERFDEVQVSFCDHAWSSWFCDIAWDRSWVVVDRREKRVTVVCTTDSD